MKRHRKRIPRLIKMANMRKFTRKYYEEYKPLLLALAAKIKRTKEASK